MMEALGRLHALRSAWTALRLDLNGENCGSPRPFASFEVRVEALRSDLNTTSTIKTKEAPSHLLVFTAVEVHPSLASIILKGVPRTGPQRPSTNLLQYYSQGPLPNTTPTRQGLKKGPGGGENRKLDLSLPESGGLRLVLSMFWVHVFIEAAL